MTEGETHYEKLGISESANAGEIKRAYYRKARELHPDVKPGHEAMMKALNEVHDELSKEPSRKEYDEKLAADRLRAEAQKRVEKARAERARSAATAKTFGDSLRDSGNTEEKPSTAKEASPWGTPLPPRPYPPPYTRPPTSTPPRATSPLQRPANSSFPAPITSSQSVLAGFGTKLLKKLGKLAGTVAFLAVPFGVMYFVAPAWNKEPNMILGAISIGCFAWFLAGLGLVFEALENLFTRWR